MFNEEQKNAIDSLHGTILVLSGAGSGKTKIIIERISKLLETKTTHPCHILIITFTQKSGRELKTRLKQHHSIGIQYDEITCGTLHNVCLKIVQNHYKVLSYSQKPIVISDWEAEKIIKDIFYEDMKNAEQDGFLFHDIIKTIYSLKSLGLNVDKWKTNKLFHNMNSKKQIFINTCYEKYEDKKKALNVLDYDDILLVCKKILENYEDIKKNYRDQWKFIHVDEYQDINPVQENIIHLLTNDELFVVGDPRQSIYGFRNCTPEFILSFFDRYPDGKIIQMQKNYRSGQEIIKISNRLIAQNEEGRIPILCEKKHQGIVELLGNFQNTNEEALTVIKKIRDLAKENPNIHYSDIVILYRCNSQSRAIEDICISNDVSYELKNDEQNKENSFYDQHEIYDILSYMKMACYEKNDVLEEKLIKCILNKPNRYIKTNDFIMAWNKLKENHSFLDAIKKLANVKNNKNMQKLYCDLYTLQNNIKYKNNCFLLIQYIRKQLEYDSWLSEHKKKKRKKDEEDIDPLSFLNELETMSKYFNKTTEFIDFLEKRITKKNESKFDNGNKNNGRIQLMSIHQSKGLEFQVVFVIGLSKNTLPHLKNRNNINEERRLCYVAFTRAIHTLYISYINDPSIFLIESELLEKYSIRNEKRNMNIEIDKQNIKKIKYYF